LDFPTFCTAQKRFSELDDERWRQMDLLRSFINEIECGLEDRNSLAGDLTIDEWLNWARGRLAQQDPLRNGPAGLFGQIADGRKRSPD
jgi:hypothetical protein